MEDKKRAAALLREIASMLELDGQNQFRVRAYQEGADAVECMAGDLSLALGGHVKGVGKGLQADLQAFLETGSIPLHAELAAKYPASVRELLHVPGLGPRKVKAVFEDLGIESLDALEEAGKLGRLATLKGFGAKTQEKILRNIAFYRANKGKALYARVIGLAEQVGARVCGIPGVKRAEIAGSLRRRREVVKDIDMVVSSDRPEAVMDAFVALPEVLEVIGKGPTKTSVRLESGIGMDLRVVTDEQYPYALLHFTGSAEHNTLLRGRAKALGLKLNEYGLWRTTHPGEPLAGDAGAVTARDESLVPCSDEAAIYATLGMPWIPPELREATGWEDRPIPALVTRSDLHGVFHCHTTASDGHATLAEMVEAARELGLEYLGISDHSKAAAYARGLDDARLQAQHGAIDALNARLDGFRVLKGVEADILRDGGVDMSPAVLAACDFVIASIHSRYSETREQMTDRICRALQSPFVTMLGHISGRLLLEREPYDLDYEPIFAAAAENGVLIEINANPERLELDWRLLQRAKEVGVRFCINPDAHSTEAIAHAYFGVNIARKGGLEPADILNTGPLAGVLEYLAGRKKALLARLG